MFRIAVLSILAVTGAISSPAPSFGVDEATAANYPFEVRLRKMHLVRPDLIPYTSLQEYFA